MVNAVAINVMVQCSETELDHYINANGIKCTIALFSHIEDTSQFPVYTDLLKYTQALSLYLEGHYFQG